MGLIKTNGFICISLGVTFEFHEKIAKNHYGAPFLKPWTPVNPLKFDVLSRTVSLGYNQVTYRSLEFGPNLEGTLSGARVIFFKKKTLGGWSISPYFDILQTAVVHVIGTIIK